MITCPCCNGAGNIEERSPVKMTVLQFRIWDVIRRAVDGISSAALVEQVYASYGGGPLNAQKSICVIIHHLNHRLAAVNQRIVSSRGRGSLYRLQHLADAK